MPFRNIPDTAARYALVAFDSDGRERQDDPDGQNGRISTRILADVGQSNPSHVFLFSHGWKGDLNSAKDQYDRWIKAMVNMPADIARMGAGFKPLWIGLHWPSQPWGESEFGDVDFALLEDAPSPAEMVKQYAKRLDVEDNTEARQLIQKIIDANQQDAAATELAPDLVAAYRRLAELAGYEAKGPDAPPDADGEPFNPVERFETANAAGVAFGGGPLGGLLGPLRQLSFWRMKKRARSCGESGMHDFVAALMRALPQARFHLMGHSFGCIVMSSILGGKDGQVALPRAVDSVTLVQGALSLWAYSKTVPGSSNPGYFHRALLRGAVRGPVVTTQSVFDRAVKVFYPLAVASVLSSAEFGAAAGAGGDVSVESLPKYGAIGTFGIQGAAGVSGSAMLKSTGEYNFQAGRIYNLEGSEFIREGGGASGAHSDIDGPEVAHVLWQAALV